MDKVKESRVNPIAKIATLAVLVLLVFEGLVIGGIFELKAQVVAKYAPWAYEPFLRLVGEHPESASRLAEVEEIKEEPETRTPRGLDISGLEPSTIPVLIATNDAMLGTNTFLEPTIPQEVESDPVPVKVPPKAAEKIEEQIIPVG
jgi:hypothetical protein